MANVDHSGWVLPSSRVWRLGINWACVALDKVLAAGGSAWYGVCLGTILDAERNKIGQHWQGQEEDEMRAEIETGDFKMDQRRDG